MFTIFNWDTQPLATNTNHLQNVHHFHWGTQPAPQPQAKETIFTIFTICNIGTQPKPQQQAIIFFTIFTIFDSATMPTTQSQTQSIFIIYTWGSQPTPPDTSQSIFTFFSMVHSLHTIRALGCRKVTSGSNSGPLVHPQAITIISTVYVVSDHASTNLPVSSK